jgi:chromosome segregation ATPase
VIQTTLFFILGFLSAGFLALMVAPAIWRRAVALTRRRIEASVPLSAEEIQADKDRMRAEFAMSTRRLEMSLREAREKAATQLIEINRQREELKRLAEDRDEKARTIAELETGGGTLRDGLRERDNELERLTERLEEAETKLEERDGELEKIGRMYDEASFNASSRQIDMVAQETRLDQLASENAALRNERKQAEQRLREVTSEGKDAREELRAAKKKLADLEKKLERQLASLSDQDEKLERREKEIVRLREQLQTVSATGGAAQPMAVLSSEERERFEEQISSLRRQNEELGSALEEERARSSGSGEGSSADAMLRERIAELAAEVVTMTAIMDEEDSPIRIALAQPAPSVAPKGEAKVVSLADRVRALQKAAAER